jgi:DNA-binding NarL/FixJ family response regulator
LPPAKYSALPGHAPCQYESMVPRVLVVSPADLSSRLGKTVLWRSDIDRVFAKNAEMALQMARDLQPQMVLVDGATLPGAGQLVRQLRQDDATRALSLAAIAGREKGASQDALRRAGANLVLPQTVSTSAFDRRLQELLAVPRRREMRLAASLQLWCRAEPTGPLREAVVLNLSVRGMLIETQEPLPVGMTVEIRLPLPGDGEALVLMGLVEREAERSGDAHRSGVQFLIVRDQVREKIRAFIEAEAR